MQKSKAQPKQSSKTEKVSSVEIDLSTCKFDNTLSSIHPLYIPKYKQYQFSQRVGLYVPLDLVMPDLDKSKQKDWSVAKLFNSSENGGCKCDDSHLQVISDLFVSSDQLKQLAYEDRPINKGETCFIDPSSDNENATYDSVVIQDKIDFTYSMLSMNSSRILGTTPIQSFNLVVPKFKEATKFSHEVQSNNRGRLVTKQGLVKCPIIQVPTEDGKSIILFVDDPSIMLSGYYESKSYDNCWLLNIYAKTLKQTEFYKNEYREWLDEYINPDKLVFVCSSIKMISINIVAQLWDPNTQQLIKNLYQQSREFSFGEARVIQQPLLEPNEEDFNEALHKKIKTASEAVQINSKNDVIQQTIQRLENSMQLEQPKTSQFTLLFNYAFEDYDIEVGLFSMNDQGELNDLVDIQEQQIGDCQILTDILRDRAQNVLAKQDLDYNEHAELIPTHGRFNVECQQKTTYFIKYNAKIMEPTESVRLTNISVISFRIGPADLFLDANQMKLLNHVPKGMHLKYDDNKIEIDKKIIIKSDTLQFYNFKNCSVCFIYAFVI